MHIEDELNISKADIEDLQEILNLQYLAYLFGHRRVDDKLEFVYLEKKQMLQLAIKKAQQEFGAKKITLGVFDNNPSALHCYESVGFAVTGTDSYEIDGEEWTGKEMELVIKNDL